MKNLKEKLNKKLSKNCGFTLIEMLIVVAIIAILVAVSIPMVSSSLDEAKKQTDAANLRAAKAEATVLYLDNIAKATPQTASQMNSTYQYYDIDKGTFSTSGGACNKSEQGGKAAGTMKIKATFTDDGVTVAWAES